MIAGLSLLCAVSGARAQSPYWGFNNNNTLNFPALSTSPFPTLLSPGGADQLNTNAHTVYDNSGQILFSVTESGVYDRGGTLIYSLVDYTNNQLLRSEIEVFPNGSACGHYYIVAYRDKSTHSTWSSGLMLWDVDASDPLYTPTITHVATLSNKLKGSVYSSISNYGYTHHKKGVDIGLVITSPDLSGNRKLYLPSYYIDPADPTATTLRFDMLSWQFNADGSYMTLPPTALNFGGSLYDEEYSGAGDKMNRVTIMEATPDGSKIAYAGAFSLKVFNTATNTITTYPINDLVNGANLGAGAITGIEWLPQYNRWYVSYVYAPTSGPSHELGKIGYFNDGITTVFNPVTVPPAINAGASELELGSDGKIYFVHCPTCSLNGGSPLGSYLPYGIQSSITTETPSSSPGSLYAIDPVSGMISPAPVAGIQVKNSIYSGRYYYLNNQIDGEDYSRWDNSSATKIGAIALETGFSGPFGSSNIYGTTLLATDPVFCDTHFANACDHLTLQFVSTVPFGFATPNYIGLAANEEYKISWYHSNGCGNATYSSSLNYTDPAWHSGATPIDLKTYGTGALSSPDAFDKFFRLEVSIRNKCTETINTYFLVFKVAIPPAASLATMSIDRYGDLSTYTAMETVCSRPACAFNDQPMIKLGGLTNIKNYKLIINDYGAYNLTCPRPPVVSYVGSNFLPISGVLMGVITLPSYLAGQCGMPYSTAMSYFTSPKRLFGIELIAETPCGRIDTLSEWYFVNCDSSMMKKTAAAINDASSIASLQVSPNPASDQLHIQVSNADQQVCTAELLDMSGKKVMDLVTEQHISSNSVGFSIHISTLPTGLYMYRYSLNGNTQSAKLIITH